MIDDLKARGTTVLTPTMRWITYKGRRVLVGDYRNLSGAPFVAAIEQNITGTLALGVRQGELLSVNVVTNSVVDKDVLEALKKLGRKCAPLVRKTAVVGVAGVQKFFLQIVSTFSSLDIKPFDTVEQAVDWLIQ